MYYVYLLKSVEFDVRYVRITDDLRRRLSEHKIGKSSHTRKFKPWKLVTYVAFDSKTKAENFETYLKHGSGHAFARKHFW